jgi:O-antigen/teichoic acid export membrane protein
MLRIISLAVIPWSMNYMYITIGRIRKSIKGIIIASVAMASLTLGLGYVLMMRMGLVGAGIGWFLGQTIIAIPSTFYLFKFLIHSQKEDNIVKVVDNV